MADRLTIQEILKAAGVTSLDEPSDALNAKGKPFRRHGIVLHVAINYQNSESTLLGTGWVAIRVFRFYQSYFQHFCTETKKVLNYLTGLSYEWVNSHLLREAKCYWSSESLS